MKRVYTTTLFVLLIINISAQDILWERTIGGKHFEYLTAALSTQDYGFVVAGSSLSKKAADGTKKNEGDFDFFLAKLDEHGKVEYTHTYGGIKTDFLQSICKASDGGYLLVGNSNSPVSGDKQSPFIGQYDIWLLKLDVFGNISWQKTLGGIGDDRAVQVIKTTDGGYLLAAASNSYTYRTVNKNVIAKKANSLGNLDYWVVKLKQDGSEEWQKTLGGKYVDELRSIIELPNNKGFVLGGISNSPMGKSKKTDAKGYNDWWVIRLDKDGDEIWQKGLGTQADEQLFSLRVTPDNHILLGGNIGAVKQKSGDSSTDFLLVKWDIEGKEDWKEIIDYGRRDILTNLIHNKDGSILISGYLDSGKKRSLKKGVEDYVVIKTDNKGKELWKKNIGTNKKEVLEYTIETRDGGYVLMGTQITHNKKHNADFWIVKLLDKDKEKVERIPIEVFPNPAKDHTTIVIGYDYQQAKISIYDFNGRLLKEVETKGNRLVPINTQNLPVGIYVVNVVSDVQDDSVKIVIK